MPEDKIFIGIRKRSIIVGYSRAIEENRRKMIIFLSVLVDFFVLLYEISDDSTGRSGEQTAGCSTPGPSCFKADSGKAVVQNPFLLLSRSLVLQLYVVGLDL